jgi:selenocysteine lyase/cysteine desulfurase
VTGASNLLGSTPDLATIVAIAHAAGANVFVDAVHLAPHRRIDVAAIGVDALVTSPYKWYGPHAGAMWVRPDLLDELPVAKVRPAPDDGPRRWETGTPAFESLAAVEAAARFLLDEDMERVGREEAAVFAPLLEGLQAMGHVKVWGLRWPAVRRLFTVQITIPTTWRALAAERMGAAQLCRRSRRSPPGAKRRCRPRGVFATSPTTT